MHQRVDAFDEIVDVDVGADGATIAPHLDGATVGSLGHLAADRRRRLLPAAAPGAFGAEAVLEPGDADRDAEPATVRRGNALGVELLPAVLVVGQRRNGV